MKERILTITPAWDRRKENYGIHSCELRFVLKSEHGAVQFVLFTGWYPSHCSVPTDMCKPMPADLGYHDTKPHYEDQIGRLDCPLVPPGCKCYYDGSGLNAQKVYDILLQKGSDGVWEYLESYHDEIFLTPEG